MERVMLPSAARISRLFEEPDAAQIRQFLQPINSASVESSV
jgi:hypothetical protein